MKTQKLIVISFMLSVLSISFFSCEKEGGCGDTNISESGGNDSHNNGQNCMQCHTNGGEGEGCFSAAGSFETFYEMIYNTAFPESFESIEMPMSMFKDILDLVINSTYEERKAHLHIIEIRKKLAPIAAVKTRWMLKKINASQIIVTPCSLKEGFFLS